MNWQRALLMLAVIAGLATMHGVVTDDHQGCAASPVMSVAGPVPGESPPGGAGHLDRGDAVTNGAAAPGAWTTGAPTFAPAPTPSPGEEQPAPAAPPFDLLSLCVAVLAAALVIALAAAVTRLARDRDIRPFPAAARVIRTQPRSPPPISVRLAQLCVLRN